MSNDLYMFSQVRESPDIELSLHPKLESKNKRYLIIGSGGCTVLSLLSQISVTDNVIIDVIDFSLSQIYLIQLKLSLICYFKSNVDGILDFYEGVIPIDRIDNIFTQLELTSEGKNYWLWNNDLLYTGINQNGVFERLFKELVKSKFNYETVFDRDNLKNKFGEDSVVNSLNHEFYDHFKGVINKYAGDETNYFYHQIMYNKYNIKYLPVYFDNLSNIIHNKNKINYIHDNIYDHVMNTSVKYDMIHTSNVTDWMNIEKCNVFINNIYNRLQDNGIVVMRRLNGDYELSKLVSDKFNLLDIPHDKSEFYSEVVAGQK